jgi:hypothetical protein
MTMLASGASAPPASIASARPARLADSAVPRAAAPAAQAVQAAADGPRRSSALAVAAAAWLVSESGIAKGLTRSGPRSSYVW